MDITILTGHVAIDNLVSEDVSGILFIVVRSSGNHFKVTVLTTCGNAVVGELLSREVHHHRTCGVHHEVNALVEILLPIGVVLRHASRTRNKRNGVDDVGTSGVLHGNTWCDACGVIRHIRQHFDKDGIVEHRGVEQLLLHGLCQVLVLSHAPCIVSIEALEGFIIGCKDGFRTRLSQRLGITHVFNEPHVIVKSTCQYFWVRILQLLIYTTSQPTRVVTLVV